VGAAIVISDFQDPHKQLFLDGHDDLITCLDLSPGGSMIASGQRGKNSDVCVWHFQTRKLIYRYVEKRIVEGEYMVKA
jgi:hypothetical protein